MERDPKINNFCYATMKKGLNTECRSTSYTTVITKHAHQNVDINLKKQTIVSFVHHEKGITFLLSFVQCQKLDFLSNLEHAWGIPEAGLYVVLLFTKLSRTDDSILK